MKLIQLNLAAGVVTPFIARGLQPSFSTPFQTLLVQNNTGGTVRVGDSTVSATRGIILASATPAGGSVTLPTALTNNGDLVEWYAYAATAGPVDIMYQE